MKGDTFKKLKYNQCKKLEINFQPGKNLIQNKILLKPYEFNHKKLIIKFTNILLDG